MIQTAAPRIAPLQQNSIALRLWSALVHDFGMRPGDETQAQTIDSLALHLSAGRSGVYRGLRRLVETEKIAYVGGNKWHSPLIVLLSDDAPFPRP